MEQTVVNRFLTYARQNTESNPDSTNVPTTSTQLDFARKLELELNTIGLQEVNVDDKGFVTATLPSNLDKKVPTIGFIAHMDTSPDFPGEGVNPQRIENYDGGDIVLNREQNIILSPNNFPDLKGYIGKTLITTDGTTLLGADDKAGIAEIVTAMEYLVNHPEIPHGKVRIGFTPDEEVGKGVDYFHVEKFGADFAYTMDGGEIGELQYENFNAAMAEITIKGRSIHPGHAKNKMVNSILIGNKIAGSLPEKEVPEHTEDYEGFFHLMQFNGTIEETKLTYILRDHSRKKFEQRKALMTKIINQINSEYGEGTVEMKLTDQYYNMQEKIEPQMQIVDIAKEAMLELGIQPLIIPIRGGTDGARLSYMGLPCPNIFNGGHNFHGKYEYIPTFAMEKAVKVILKIIEKVSQ